MTVRTANDTVIVPTGDIVARKQTPLSIMPEGLFDQMKPDEVRDLVAYLGAKEQVPIPKKVEINHRGAESTESTESTENDGKKIF